MQCAGEVREKCLAELHLWAGREKERRRQATKACKMRDGSGGRYGRRKEC